MSGLEVRAYNSLEGCAPLRGAMALVNDESPRPCPFSTFEFLSEHVEYNGIAPGSAGGEPLVLTAFRGEELVGYMPLCKARDRVLGQEREKITYLVRHDVDRPHLVARADDLSECAEAFYRELVESERDWTLVDLEQQDASSPLYPLPSTVDTHGLSVRLFENAANATIDVVYPTLADYYRSLSRKMRSNVGRCARRLFDAGDVQIVSSVGAEGADAWLDLYRSVEDRSWKNGIDWVVGSSPERVAFFRRLMGPDQPMQITVTLLALDGCPIAGIINGRYGKGMHALQIAHDDRFSELDPGAMMLLWSMKKAIDDRCDAYDLLSGYGYYKERWLARITPSRSVQLFRRGSLHHLKAIGGDCKRQVLGFVDRQASAKRNLAKAAKQSKDEVASDHSQHDAGRGDARRALGELLASGISVDTLSRDELVAAMPFDTKR